MAYDKKIHFIGGLIVSLIIGYLFLPMYGLGAAVILGAVKELYDSTQDSSGQPRGTVELLDFIATVAGGVIGYIALIGLCKLVF